FLELDDLVVDLHPPAPAHDHVHLLLRLVRVAVRKAIAGRDALVAQGGSLELERLRRRAELQIRRAVEPRTDVLQILLDVPERERHAAILCGGTANTRRTHILSSFVCATWAFFSSRPASRTRRCASRQPSSASSARTRSPTCCPRPGSPCR